MIVSSCRILPLFMREWPMIFNTSNSMIKIDYKNINTDKMSAFKLKKHFRQTASLLLQS